VARYHCRCRECEARRVLPKKPDEYFKWSVKKCDFVNFVPPCKNCGAKNYRIDKWMNQRDTRKSKCDCAGYVHMTRREWPHRIGSLYCWYRKDGAQRMPGDADFRDFHMEQECQPTSSLPIAA
jgi:hypothetical protein